MAETNEEAVALGQPPKEVRRLGAQTARSRAGISALPPRTFESERKPTTSGLEGFLYFAYTVLSAETGMWTSCTYGAPYTPAEELHV
jgi:hypothetical protein